MKIAWDDRDQWIKENPEACCGCGHRAAAHGYKATQGGEFPTACHNRRCHCSEFH
jgi:hypothetical protein